MGKTDSNGRERYLIELTLIYGDNNEDVQENKTYKFCIFKLKMSALQINTSFQIIIE